MAVHAYIHFFSRDNQNYTETTTYEIPAFDFAAGQDLPTVAEIDAIQVAMFGPGGTGHKMSTSICYAYSVELVQDDPASVTGDGTVATAIAAKTRSGIGVTGNTDPFGNLEGEEIRIPGLNKASVIFDPVNPNSIATTTAIWTALRTALDAVGWVSDGGHTYSTAEMMESAVQFNGKRAPKRSR